MENYIDGFVFPIKQVHLAEYKEVAHKVSAIWKEYGATAYFEYVGDDLSFEGVRSFTDAIAVQQDEVVIFGWVVFPSKDVRDQANEQVPKDPRMNKLVESIMDPKRLVFDASRMVYGGFNSLVS